MPPVKSNSLLTSFVLGTVQLGLPYGIANKAGMPSVEEARKILQEALDLGVNQFDTAQAYGESEKRLGQLLPELTPTSPPTIVTKLSPFSDWSPTQSTSQIQSLVQASVNTSRHHLQRHTLDVLMLHRWEHHDLYQGDIWNTLLQCKKDGLINKLGASVQSPHEALKALDDPLVEVIQLPFNILDWRWEQAGVIDKIRKQKRARSLTIHTRSVFLQGLLLMPATQWPQLSNKADYDAKELVNKLHSLQLDHNRPTLQDLYVSYVRSQDWVDSLVMGVETTEQLIENTRLFSAPLLSAENCHMITTHLHDPLTIPEYLLNPSEWIQ